jgi:nucleotide-binding universal stress UspA family protein
MFKNILIPLDGSKLAEETIETATTLAKAFQGKLTTIYVYELYSFRHEDRETEYEHLKSKMQGYFGSIVSRFKQVGVELEAIFKTGSPGLEICRFAKEKNFDLIIMASHGLGGVRRLAFGSVSNMVLTHSSIPVLLLRPSMTAS